MQPNNEYDGTRIDMTSVSTKMCINTKIGFKISINMIMKIDIRIRIQIEVLVFG